MDSLIICGCDALDSTPDQPSKMSSMDLIARASTLLRRIIGTSSEKFTVDSELVLLYIRTWCDSISSKTLTRPTILHLLDLLCLAFRCDDDWKKSSAILDGIIAGLGQMITVRERIRRVKL